MLPKPDSCAQCSLYEKPFGKVSGFVPADGTGSNGVLVVLEAAGKDEEASGLPTVGRAGQYLWRELKRIDLERDDFRIHNVLSCFTNPRTSVRTNLGYRPINSLRVGDQVLTHQGRFKAITATHFYPRMVLPHYLVHLSDGSQHGVTGGHGWILTNGQAVPTEDLELGMQVPGLCEACEYCGEHFHRGFRAGQNHAFCSKRCFNIAISRGARGKIRQAMIDQYASGSRDRFAITKAANRAMRMLVESGEWTAISTQRQTDEARRCGRVRAAMAREALGLRTQGTWIGDGETDLHDLLVAAGYDAIPQFAIDRYNFDFKVGQALIEVDNPARDCQKNVRERKLLKDALAQEHGYSVIHVPSTQVSAALDHLKNDTHDFVFHPVTVERIERRRDRAGVWSCEVADDASYVVKGIAHHNCRPPANELRDMPYTATAIAHCAPNLDATIEDMRERCRQNGTHLTILCLGDFAARRILGLDETASLKEYLSYVHWSETYQAYVIVSYHPSHLMQGKHHLIPLLHYAARKAVEVARDGFQAYEGTYLCDPAPPTFAQWVRDYLQAATQDPEGTYLAFDIETPYKHGKNEEDITKESEELGDDYTILRCSFSYRVGEAVSVPWTAAYMPYLEELFQAPFKKIAHNVNYDLPRIQVVMPVNGTIIDTMVAWHMVNTTLPKGLGFITPFYVQNAPMWKHLSRAEPARYNAIDSDVTLHCWEGIQRNLKENGQWEVFHQHVVRLNTVLGYMSGKGVLRDPAIRDDAERQLVERLGAVTERIDATVPLQARQLHPPQGYVKEPTATDGLIRAPFTVAHKVCSRCQVQGVSASHVKAKKPIVTCGICGKPVTTRHAARCEGSFPIERPGNLCEGATLTPRKVTVERWAKPLAFKDSQVQLLAYQKTVKHAAILNRKVKRVTFDEGAILRLMKQHPQDPLYPLLLEHREYQKLLSVYIGTTGEDGIRGGMPVGKDGRIHSLYTHNPSTLRLASQGPNMQNLPRPAGPEDLATMVRNMIVAAPGHVLVARDFSGIEAVLVGYEARSPEYIRLAKIDVHSYYTAYALYELDRRIPANDLPDIHWDDDRLIPHLAGIKKAFKQERNNLYKHLIHACLTKDHEVLTEAGWVPIQHLQPQTAIAQWDPSGQIAFATPLHHHVYPKVGGLIKMQSCSLSAVMTSEHRIPTFNTYGSFKERDAGEALTVRDWRIPVCGMLTTGQVTIDDPLEWLRLTVAIQADGSLSGRKVIFHLVKPRKWQQLEDLLHILHVDYRVQPCRDHPTGRRYTFTVAHTPIMRYLDRTKTFNLQALLALPPDARRVFLDELPLWDGHRPATRRNHQTFYVTAHRGNAETVQIVAHLTHRQALLREVRVDGKRPLWTVSFNCRTQARLQPHHVSTVPDPHDVYCLTVPSGWFVIRHQNRVSITGNSNFGQTPTGAQAKIFLETRVEQPLKKITNLMKIYKELFPAIPRWQQEVQCQADRDGYLRNAFNYIHRFYKVFSWTKEHGAWVKKLGEDADKVLAFKPQSNAAGILKESMLRIFFDRFETLGQYLRLTVHDELLCECPEEMADAVDRGLKEEMERPILQMALPASYRMGSHLVIGTEGKIGTRWGTMNQPGV